MATATKTRPALILRYDFRAPEFGASSAELFAGALEQAAYVEQHGFELVTVSEHHHAEDGYLPAPFVAAAAFAARTSKATIRPSALVLPLHDPIRAAEDLAVIDVISNGRLEVTVAAGYRELEFEMLGKSFSDRGTRLRRAVEVLRRAWTGEPFTYEGKSALVRPTPVRPGGPPIIMAGSTPKTARRAAEIADGYDPSTPALMQDYLAACAELGKEPGQARPRVGTFFMHISEDPERDRARLAPHVQHEMQMYVNWSGDMTITGGGRKDSIPIETVWDAGSHMVLTPEEAVEYIASLDPNGVMAMHPLAGGIRPEWADESLQLFVEKVLPHLESPEDRAARTATDEPAVSA